MLKDKNKQIVDTLISATKNGSLIWSEYDPKLSTRPYKREMCATGEDGTKYEMEIKYTMYNSSFKIESSPAVWLRNKDLPNGMYQISEGVTELRDLVKSMFCMDMNPKVDDICDKLDDICKGISISTYRDIKIDNILNE